MSQLPSVCCVSLTKWKDYIGREQGDLLGASLGAFVDSECPNRPAIQQSYLTALANLETEVKKIVMILQQLDCSPLQISQFSEDAVSDRTLFMWWNEPKNITSNKHRLCGEDVEFQGGRKVQQHPVPGCHQVIEYQCTTPKKGSSPWSRSIIKLQGSQLWVVNYRPRRVRSSGSPSKKRTRIPLLSKKRPKPAQQVHTPNKPQTFPTGQNSPQQTEWRIPVSRAASDTLLNNTYYNIEPPAEEHTMQDTQNWASANFQSPLPTFNCSPSPHMDIDMEPPSPQYYSPGRTLGRTVSEPHRQFPNLEVHQQQNGEMPCYLPQIKDPTFPSLQQNERLVMYLVDKALSGRYALSDIATEASHLLSFADMQQFNAVLRLIISPPVRDSGSHLTKQARLLLYIAGCVSPMTRSEEAIRRFAHLFSLVHFNDQQPRNEGGMWHTDMCFVKQQHMVHGQRRMYYVYGNPEFVNVMRQLRLRIPVEEFIGKTDFELFDETFALRFLEEDFGTLEAQSGGISVDNCLPLPCPRRCWNCRISASKFHMSLYDGSFMFCCATAIQCSANIQSPPRHSNYGN
uniref:Uncharacterized protein n=1 Tax=Vannella robusta TaxID=1487602 RepID=A0A7S4HID4_9EUKA